MTQQSELENWDGFLGSNFLRVENVKSEKHEFVCIKIELDEENQRPMLVLESEGIKFKMSLNVTNSTFVKNAGIKSPNDLLGKKLRFNVVQAFSPKVKQMVDSLRIISVE